MKPSKKPTGNIIIPANSNSEWDTCTHVLVTYNEETLKRWQDYANALQGIISNTKYPQEIHCLTIWESCLFLKLDEEEYAEIYDKVKKSGFVYVDLKKGELDNLDLVEQSVDVIELKIYREGNLSFSGYGKHTGEEFWSNKVPLDKL